MRTPPDVQSISSALTGQRLEARAKERRLLGNAGEAPCLVDQGLVQIERGAHADEYSLLMQPVNRHEPERECPESVNGRPVLLGEAKWIRRSPSTPMWTADC
jgi:hypothetical protein